MQRRLNTKLTCFIVQKYDPVEHIFALSLHSRAVANFPQDLGRVATSVLGDTFAVHHRMFLEPCGSMTQQLLAHCSNELAPVITLSILSIYSSTIPDLESLIKSSFKPSRIDILDGIEMPLLNCSSDAPLWPIGPLLIFQPHIILSPTSLPSFSVINCVLSFLSFSSTPTYAMHLGTALHNNVQSRFTNDSTKAISDQISELKSIWTKMGLDSGDLEQLISASKIHISMTNTEMTIAHTSIENEIKYSLLKKEPTIALQNNDIEFTEALVAIKSSNKLAHDVIATQEALMPKADKYVIEKHIVSTDLGIQGKIDLLGITEAKATNEVQKKFVVELKTTSINGTKREVHFMQACTYFYATCIEEKINDSTLLGCDVIGIKKGVCNHPFQLFGNTSFITFAELAKKQPHNPIFYFLQMYTVFRATYLLLLELSAHLVSLINIEDCCIDATQFIEILCKNEPKYCLRQANYAPFLVYLFKFNNPNSITMKTTQKSLMHTLIETHKHITGDMLTPLAILTWLQTVKVGEAYYSFLRLRSGCLEAPSMCRSRFILTTDSSLNQKFGDAHCIASNIFVRVLACATSLTLCSQIILLESSYDLSLMNAYNVSEFFGYWALYPLLPEGSVAARSLSILMSSPIDQIYTPENVLDTIDQKLVNLECSVQRCSLATLENAVKGPFYNNSILLLVNKEESHKLPQELLAVFARRGICTVHNSTWPVNFSDTEINSVLAEKVSVENLLGSATSKWTAFVNSFTKMAAVSPIDLLDFPILRQSYGTIYVFTDSPNSQNMHVLDYKAAYNDFYAVIAMLPEYKSVFFVHL